MSDYAKLKVLAEAATPGQWASESGNLYWYEDGYTKHLMETEDGSDICHEDQHPANLMFIAAANPAVVLGLIAEIERLRAANNTVECRFEVSEDTLSTIRGCLRSAEGDIDQLKAECEGLREKASCVDDCAAIIRKLVRKLRKAALGNALTDPAMDYLKRKGLQGSPLRSGSEGVEPVLDTPDQSGKWTAEDEASSRTIYEQWANLCEYVPWVEGGNSLKQEEARRMHCAIEGKAYCYGR